MSHSRCIYRLYYVCRRPILLSPCVAGVQNVLDVCTVYSNEFDIIFSAKKCMFMVVGKRLMRTQASSITVCISGIAIPYVDKIKYKY